MMRVFARLAMLFAAGALLWGCTGNPASEGWITLLDKGGNGLENFSRVGDANWRVEDGALVADRGGKTSSFLVSRQSYTDFVIHAEFWVNAEANSGVFIRLSDRQVITAKNSYEVQINDKHPEWPTGTVAYFGNVAKPHNAGGRWNTFEITARGPRLTVKMNGVETTQVNDRSFFHGPFALQYVSGIVKFRTVQIKPL